MRPRPDTNVLYRFPMLLPEGTTEATGAGPQFAPSPDGRLIAFVAASGDKQMLWIRPVGSLSAGRLERTELVGQLERNVKITMIDRA